MIISNLAYDKWLRAKKGQLACYKNIGSRTIPRDSDESSVNSLAFFKAKSMCSRPHCLCNIQELDKQFQKERAALTTTCSETSVVTVTEMERHQTNFLASKFSTVPSLQLRGKRSRPCDELVLISSLFFLTSGLGLLLRHALRKIFLGLENLTQ